MNWTHFLLWLAGIYILYYLIVFLLDLIAGNRKDLPAGTSQELTFSEEVTPVRLSPEAESTPEPEKPTKSKIATEVIGSGGVPITDLFRLAKQEAIIYTRSVSF